MLLRSLFLKTLRDLRGQIWGWGLGIGSLGVFVIALYPFFRDQMNAFVELLKGYPAALTAFFGDLARIGEWSGWLSVEFFSYVAPILAIFAVGVGVGLVAGEEEKGTLDLLLSQPVRRWRVVVDKFAAFTAATLLVCALIAVCLGGSAAAIGQTDGMDRLLLATLDLAPITLASGALALMASVLFRRKRWATAVAVAVIIGSWFVEALGKVVDVLRPYRPFTLLHYYNGGSVLTGEMNWGNVGVLLGLTVLFVAISLVAFQRRDIAV